MTGTSISSQEKRGYEEHYITSETIVTSEKVEDFLSTSVEKEHYGLSDRASAQQHLEEEEDSPIEEVRAVVPNTDDPDLPVYTFRVVFLGLIFTCFLAFVNQFFFYRDNPMVVGALVVQLISFPIAKFMEKIIPKSKFFNPGPFNVKEHVLIVVMANCSYQTAYAMDIITIQRIYYGQNMGWGGGILLIWTTQLIGFGLGGILRKYLVYPASMVWPANLATISLLRSLHQVQDNWTGPSRFRWFLYMFGAMFVYQWFPSYFWPILGAFSWICWINPRNLILSQVTGSKAMGILAFSFDWSQIVSYLMNPLVVPGWAIANIAVAFVIVAWIIGPAMYYSNVWDAQKFPMITSKLFTTNGDSWVNSKVLTADRLLDEAAYAEYGPLRMAPFFALNYGIGFAGITCILVHTYLYHGKEIVARFRESRTKENNDDIHMKLMRVYPEVPQWWYAVIFIASFGVSFGVIYGWPIYLPWWGLILAVAISVIFSLPIGIITAITNQTPGLNIITELIIGFALPGHPIANVTFKTYGYISMVQAITFVSDLKLGHYTKVPPRAMFWAQIAGTILAGLINLATGTWLMDTVKDICSDGAAPWTCPNANVFYSASIIWGVIGPQKMFGPGSPYNAMLWFLLIGLLLPIPFYFLAKRYPNSWFKYVHIPLFLNALGMMPPATPINYFMWCSIGFFFMTILRRYKHDWWVKYNYVTAAAFDTASSIATLIIFGVQTGTNVYEFNWWGSGGQVYSGLDYVAADNCPLSMANGQGVCHSCSPAS
ncbi:Putative OPT family small oligopeptide transporter [Rhizopus microsporus]|nr:Putative OPT family small oligopeptide transporter [Rhizopus microsporus]